MRRLDCNATWALIIECSLSFIPFVDLMSNSALICIREANCCNCMKMYIYYLKILCPFIHYITNPPGVHFITLNAGVYSWRF